MAKAKAAPTATASQKTTAKSSQNKKASGSRTSCAKNHKAFCYVCAKYIFVKSRVPFSEAHQARYRETFKVTNLKNFGRCFSGSCLCIACSIQLYKRKGKFTRPAVWHAPTKKDHEDCYICDVMGPGQKGPVNMRQKLKKEKKNVYKGNLNVELADQSDKAAPLEDDANSVWDESSDEQMEAAAAADDDFY